MALSLLWPDRRIKVPSVAVAIDRKHPLARGLSLCTLMNAGAPGLTYDLALQQAFTGAGSSIAGPFGAGVQFSGSQALTCASNYVTGSTAMSVVAWVLPRATANATDYSVIGNRNVNTGWNFGTRGVTGAATAKIRLTFRFVADYLTTTAALSLNAPACIAFAWNGSNSVSFYKDGALVDSPVATSTPGAGTQMAIGSGGAVTPTSYWVGDIYHVFAYGRALSADEMRWLSAEPFCFLAPLWRRNYIPVAGAVPSFKPSWVARPSRSVGLGVI